MPSFLVNSEKFRCTFGTDVKIVGKFIIVGDGATPSPLA